MKKVVCLLLVLAMLLGLTACVHSHGQKRLRTFCWELSKFEDSEFISADDVLELVELSLPIMNVLELSIRLNGTFEYGRPEQYFFAREFEMFGQTVDVWLYVGETVYYDRGWISNVTLVFEGLSPDIDAHMAIINDFIDEFGMPEGKASFDKESYLDDLREWLMSEDGRAVKMIYWDDLEINGVPYRLRLTIIYDHENGVAEWRLFFGKKLG